MPYFARRFVRQKLCSSELAFGCQFGAVFEKRMASYLVVKNFTTFCLFFFFSQNSDNFSLILRIFAFSQNEYFGKEVCKGKLSTVLDIQKECFPA